VMLRQLTAQNAHRVGVAKGYHRGVARRLTRFWACLSVQSAVVPG
jgi:hypothetical protein